MTTTIHPMTPKQAYDAYCGEMTKNFEKPWDKVGQKLDFGYRYLDHIPAHAFKDMAKMAMDAWEKWPSNFVKATKTLYELWRKSSPSESQRSAVFCEYCNGNGHFTSIMPVEVKPGILVNYRFSWRCAACSNWFGKLGTDIPARYPLEVKSNGHTIELYPVPPAIATDKADRPDTLDLSQLISLAGVRSNPKTSRPDYQPYND